MVKQNVMSETSKFMRRWRNLLGWMAPAFSIEKELQATLVDTFRSHLGSLQNQVKAAGISLHVPFHN